MAREILEPVDHDSGEHRVRVTRSSHDGADNDNDHDDEVGDLPSLHDIFAQAEREFGGRSGLEASTLEAPAHRTSKDRASPAATTATSVQPDTSQDKPEPILRTTHKRYLLTYFS
jgi:hypothetical protein